MKKSKGCFNKKCNIYNEKKFLDVDSEFCPECGEKLSYVCKYKDCYKKIKDNQKYCKAHAEMNKNFIEKTIGIVGLVILAVGGILLFPIKKIFRL